ncbi:Clp protease N-terminal domain-containing protein [Frankia gtarii]|uniref:Clp protease N-terminal domain-containing protein n=1 Tax=Frankia gtarii TaxID=2950102 RepID=UPI0021BF515F|nr:Clp protease N-terminal domain-containing protein [Frankia gtarii]
MFEKFTPQSRAVVRAATQVAAAFEHDRVHSGHLLFAIVTEGGAVGRALAGLGLDEPSLRTELHGARVLSRGGREVDTDALAAIGVDYEAIRAAADERFGAGVLGLTMVRKAPRRSWWRRRPRSRGPRFSAEAGRALERAVRLAATRGDGDLTPLHLLLGMLADQFSLAAGIIVRRETSLEQVRHAAAAAAAADDADPGARS